MLSCWKEQCGWAGLMPLSERQNSTEMLQYIRNILQFICSKKTKNTSIHKMIWNLALKMQFKCKQPAKGSLHLRHCYRKYQKMKLTHRTYSRWKIFHALVWRKFVHQRGGCVMLFFQLWLSFIFSPTHPLVTFSLRPRHSWIQEFDKDCKLVYSVIYF